MYWAQNERFRLKTLQSFIPTVYTQIKCKIILADVTGCPKLTKDGPCRHRLAVEPKGDLWQDYSHEARHVRLDDKVADLPLQVKVSHHHRVLTCGKQWNKRGGNAQRVDISVFWKWNPYSEEWRPTPTGLSWQRWQWMDCKLIIEYTSFNHSPSLPWTQTLFISSQSHIHNPAALNIH